MKRESDNGPISVCFVGFDPDLETRFRALCLKYACSLTSYKDPWELAAHDPDLKIDILIFDGNFVGQWQKGLAGLYPQIIIGGTELTDWVTCVLPSSVRQVIVQGNGAGELEGTLEKILSTFPKQKESKNT